MGNLPITCNDVRRRIVNIRGMAEDGEKDAEKTILLSVINLYRDVIKARVKGAQDSLLLAHMALELEGVRAVWERAVRKREKVTEDAPPA